MVLSSIIVNGRKGYSNHPETLRWMTCGWALACRHHQLASEMSLRGYTDKSPVTIDSNPGQWPETYIDSPARQIELLRAKYVGKEPGRIPLPDTAEHLWRHHKYSVLARNPSRYKEIGQGIAHNELAFEPLALELTELLRVPPSMGGIRNAIQHMWGYVSESTPDSAPFNSSSCSLSELLVETQHRASAQNRRYLLQSTALSELMVWLP